MKLTQSWRNSMTLVARIVFCLLVATDFTAINISHIQAQGNSVDETIVLPPVVHDITMNYECKKNLFYYVHD